MTQTENTGDRKDDDTVPDGRPWQRKAPLVICRSPCQPQAYYEVPNRRFDERAGRQSERLHTFWREWQVATARSRHPQRSGVSNHNDRESVTVIILKHGLYFGRTQSPISTLSPSWPQPDCAMEWFDKHGRLDVRPAEGIATGTYTRRWLGAIADGGQRIWMVDTHLERGGRARLATRTAPHLSDRGHRVQ